MCKFVTVIAIDYFSLRTHIEGVTMNRKDMQIVDFKAILGMIGTAITWVATWIQDTLELTSQVPLTDWIPLIPAIPTAIYMGFKAWEKYRHITNGDENETN